MSGGSYNYLYNQIEWTYKGHMKDPELELLMKDLIVLLKGLEWCDSGDTDDKDYFAEVNKFKAKWLGGDQCREERLTSIIEEQCAQLHDSLIQMVKGYEEKK